MSKKKRIRELERRVALLEAEVSAQRAQRITWVPPTTPNPFPGTWPQITCTNPTSGIPGRIARAALLSGRN